MRVFTVIFFRKLGSFIFRSEAYFSSVFVKIRSKVNPGIIFSEGCQFGSRVVLKATDGGSITLGARVFVGRGASLIAQSGEIVIDDDVHIGEGAIIVCRERVHVGSDVLIAEYVVIRDQDHEVACRPIRLSGFLTSPIDIGRDVWVGCKATILRGAKIGDGAVVGAHALVRGDIPSGALGVGVPARVVRLAKDAK